MKQVVQKSGQNGFHSAAKLGLLFLMYISQKVFLTFTWTLLPIILRKQGVSLGTIGLTALIYSPWALKFVHASLVDRIYSKRLGKRKSWIMPLLFLSWGILPFLAMLSPFENFFLVLGIVFILNILFATIDIAVDGYATDILAHRERPWGNAIQMVGYLSGYMLGAGVFLVVYQNRGWTQTILLITAVQFMFMLPVILHREIPPASNELTSLVNRTDSPSVWPLLRQSRAIWFLAFLTVITIFDQGGNQLRLPLFADLGISPRELGYLNIWIGAPISILGALAGGALVRFLGARRLFLLCCLGAVVLSLFSAWISTHGSPARWQVTAVIGMDKLVVGIVTVFTCTMTMTMSAGPQSATNYALLSSVSHLIGFIIMPFSALLCDRIGYFNLFSSLAITGFLSIFIGDYILRKALAGSDW